MGAYVLDEPTPSADAGATCWAGAGGLATTVVMVACGRPCGGRWEGQIDCRSEEWQGLVGSPLHQVSRDVGSPGGFEAGATLSRGRERAWNYARICSWAGAAKELGATRSSAGVRGRETAHVVSFGARVWRG